MRASFGTHYIGAGPSIHSETANPCSTASPDSSTETGGIQPEAQRLTAQHSTTSVSPLDVQAEVAAGYNCNLEVRTVLHIQCYISYHMFCAFINRSTECI